MDEILTREEVTEQCAESPLYTREECLEKKTKHGGAGIRLSGNTYCLWCHTIYNDEDRQNRIDAFGGPGHWIGCTLDPYHEGGCIVGIAT